MFALPGLHLGNLFHPSRPGPHDRGFLFTGIVPCAYIGEMETASNEQAASVITPPDEAAKIVKPSELNIAPPVENNNSPADGEKNSPARLIDATDLLSGNSTVITDEKLGHPADNLPGAVPTTETPPATDATTGEVKRGRGRPKGSKTRPSFDDVTAVETVVNYEELAGFVFDSSTGSLSMALGPEWRAKTPEERQGVVIVLAAYLKSKNVKDIPPGVMLTIVLLAYATPRLKEPETASKIKLGFAWFRFKAWPTFTGFFRRKKNNVVKLNNETQTANTN